MTAFVATMLVLYVVTAFMDAHRGPQARPEPTSHVYAMTLVVRTLLAVWAAVLLWEAR